MVISGVFGCRLAATCMWLEKGFCDVGVTIQAVRERAGNGCVLGSVAVAHKPGSCVSVKPGPRPTLAWCLFSLSERR